MKHIQGNIGVPLILSIDKSENIKWYIDASFVGSQRHEDSHWWFHEHRNRRGLCKTELKKKKRQEFK